MAQDSFNWQQFLIDQWKAGETQVALAGRLGVTDAMIRALLGGRRPFTWEMKRRMAQVWDGLWGPLIRELKEPRNGTENW